MQKRKRDTDVQNRLLDSVGEGEGGMFWENSIETCNQGWKKSPAQVGCMRQVLGAGALWRPRGMGWEVGGGIGMRSTCKSMADSCQCMAKTTTIL